MIAFGVVVVMVWTVWAALTASPTETSKPQSSDSSTPSTESATDETGEGEATERSSQGDPAEDGESTNSVVRQTDGTTISQSSTDSEPGTPLLGGDVDYDLLITTSAGRPAVLDLDTGVVRYTDGSRVVPVAVSGSWLAIERTSSPEIARLPLNDLGADPVPLFDERDIIFTHAVPTAGRMEPGQLWVSVQREADGTNLTQFLYLVDLSSGSTIDHPFAGEVSWRLSIIGGRYADSDGGILTGPAGGVYMTLGDGFEQVADGRLLAADHNRALVEDCDAFLHCDRAWLDRGTWQPLDLAVPDSEYPFVVVIPETDWVLVTGLSGMGPHSLFNVRNSQAVDVSLPERSPSSTLPAVSPDGKWLAEPGEDPRTVILRDLANGDTIGFTLNKRIRAPLFFVEE